MLVAPFQCSRSAGRGSKLNLALRTEQRGPFPDTQSGNRAGLGGVAVFARFFSEGDGAVELSARARV